MTNRIAIVLLVLLCLGLGIALVTTRKKATVQQADDFRRIGDYSNQVVSVTDQLDRQREVNAQFEKDLAQHRKALGELTNNYTQVSANLNDVSSNLARTEQSLKSSQQELAKRDSTISELENKNQALDKHALDLSLSITNLTTQIAETQRKLAASEGDKAFLESELKRLMAEKAELERQFNDLAVLRAQVSKLKEELNIARRIEWIRRGLFASSEEKGAQKLMRGVTPPETHPKVEQPSYDLNVEVHADGSVKVIPPLNRTNSPSAK